VLLEEVAMGSCNWARLADLRFRLAGEKSGWWGPAWASGMKEAMEPAGCNPACSAGVAYWGWSGR